MEGEASESTNNYAVTEAAGFAPVHRERVAIIQADYL
jgi:hypothetical protein